MAIQWPLVFYTLLTGLGVGAFAFVAITEWWGKAERTRLPGAITALVSLVLGGIASVLHLGHLERIFNALGNLGSGIAQEFILVSLTGLAILVYIVMMRLGYPAQTRKIVATIGLALSVILVLVQAGSYVLPARPAWNTWLLPLLYLASAAVLGLFTMYIWTVVSEQEEAAVVKFMDEAALVALIAQAVVIAAYVVYLVVAPEASPVRLLAADLAIGFWVGVVLVGIVIPVALTAWVRLSTKKVLPVLTVASAGLACILVGGITIRAILFLLGGRVSTL